MKNNSRKFAPVFRFLACMVTCIVTLACFDSYYDHAFDSSLTPEAFVDRSYTPLLFSNFEKFHGIPNYDDTSERFFNEENLELWSGFLEGKVSHEQVRLVLFTDSADKELQMLADARLNGKTSLTGPISGINCKHHPSSEFLDYVLLAKTIQTASLPVVDYWNYENRLKVFVAPAVFQEANRRYESATDPFLKQRYWYQSVKGRFYSGNSMEAASYFQATREWQAPNTLYYQAMAYAAGAYRRGDQLMESNLLYAEVFDKFPRLRSKVILSFKMMNETQAEECANLASDAGTKSAIWTMNGFYSDEIQAARKIISIDPASPHLDVLLTRMVNKWEFNLCNGGNQVSTGQQAARILEIMDELCSLESKSNDALCLMASAYLHTLQGDKERAQASLNKLDKEPRLTPIQKDQLRVIRIINKIRFMASAPYRNEQELLAELKWLVSKNRQYYESDSDPAVRSYLRAERTLGWVCNELSRSYSKSGNMEMAELFRRGIPETGVSSAENCFADVDLHPFFKSPINTDKMLKFMESESLTDWERFAVSLYPVNASDIHEYKAILATYRGDLAYAASEMALAGDLARQELLSDPFKGSIKDCNDCDRVLLQPVKYTKRDFVNRMHALSKNIQQGKELFESHLVLANAFYNISEVGNARLFYSNTITGGMSTYIDEIFPGTVGSMQMARKHYQMALKNAPNREAMAKCHYMLAKCERNDYYSNYENLFSQHGEGFVAFKEWKGFGALRTEFSDTRFYQDVLQECGYFSTYMEKVR